MENELLYKYRPFKCRSLVMLKKRELYFSDPKHFNDPVDCRIGIFNALISAVNIAEKDDPAIKAKLSKLGTLDDLLKKIENDVKTAGIYSLSQEQNNVLMWSHYAESHTGFSVGFALSKKITEYNEENSIVGSNEVYYSEDNPFVEYFTEFSKCHRPPNYNEFWVSLFSMGLVGKSKSWEYEKEIRIVRHIPGKVNFEPSELRELIFGLEMSPRKRKIIRKILAGEEWRHVEFKEVVRKNDGYSLKVVSC